MERAKKMVLIPQESLQKMQASAKSSSDLATSSVNKDVSASDGLKTVQTEGTNLSRLDSEMRKVLDSEKYSTDNEKYKDFLQILQRYLFFTEEKRRPVESLSMNNFDNSMSDEYILSSLPKLYKKKAKLLLEHLKTVKSRIHWNENGTVTIDGEEIKDSNIIDLINDAARARKNVKPLGRKQFVRVLRSTSTPKEFVGNAELWNLGNLSSSSPHSRLRQDKSISWGEEYDDSTTALGDKSDSSLFSSTVINTFSPNKSSERVKKRRGARTSTPLPKNKWLRLNKT